MNERIKTTVNIVYEFLFAAVLVVIPFLFLNLTTEFYEMPKLLILTVFAGIFILLWGVKSLLSGKITIAQTVITIPLIGLLLVAVASTFFAASQSIAIFGNFPRVSAGLMAYVVYFVLFIMAVTNLRRAGAIKFLLNILLFVGIILSVWSILSYFKIYLLPFSWTQMQNFTPTGSTFSTNAILILLLPFLFGGNFGGFVKNYRQIATSIILALFLAVILLTGSLPVYGATALVIVLSLLSVTNQTYKKILPFLALPAITVILLAVAVYVPLKGIPNPVASFVQSFPREIQLPLTTSWKVSVSAFRDFPLIGSGPGSYLNDFTAYKPVNFNNTNLWNLSFDSAFNEYFQVLATMGALGLFALILLTIMFLSPALRTLMSQGGGITSALAVSGIAFFILLAIHPATLVLWVIGLIILALFVNIRPGASRELHIGIGDNPMPLQKSGDELYLRFDVLPTVVMIIILAGVVGAFYFAGKFALADYNHRQALVTMAKGDGLSAYNSLVRSEQLSPNIDTYRLDLAQTNFALANSIAAAKGPSESSPAGSLTDTDKQNIQTLLSQAISEGRVATVINPNSALNWEILGGIYQQISGVAQNALTFSLDSYGRAIQRDPVNPLLRLSVGGIYYSIKSYDNAIRFFSDAVSLKPDFANGYYNLTVALRDKGDFQSAVVSAEKLVSLLDQASPDYETATKLLADLKSKTSTESAQSSPTTGKTDQQPLTPASKTNSSALQKDNLPKVLDLPKVENIATPPAVKK